MDTRYTTTEEYGKDDNMAKVAKKIVLDGEEVNVPGGMGVTETQMTEAINTAISDKITSTSISEAIEITEDEYNALASKSTTTLYVIPEEE